jgi:hypothetical protein
VFFILVFRMLSRLRVADDEPVVHAGDALVTSLREPARFFDALYRRFLRESAPNLHALCLRGMARVYRKHRRAIGEFEDTEHIIYLLLQSTHQEVSDRLLELLDALGEEPLNAEKMINEECLQVGFALLLRAAVCACVSAMIAAAWCWRRCGAV